MSIQYLKQAPPPVQAIGTATAETVTMLARLEGILLDPVYSGKGMAGLIDLIRKGQFKKGHNVVFLRNGGAVGMDGCMHAFQGVVGRPA